MAASLSIIAAKDGTGTTIAGGIQALDLSGAGTGPWSMANILVDGVSGSNRAAVTASNALKVDGSGVTQPVSAASLPLPTGASTSLKQPALGTAGTASSDVITIQGIASMTPLQVTGSLSSSVVQGTYTDRSGTITTGGTSQQIMASNGSRKRFLVQNPSTATESLWINFTSAATASEPSIELTPGGAYDSSAGPVTTEAVNVIAATSAHPFTAKEM